LEALGLPASGARIAPEAGCLFGQSFIFSYFDGPIEAQEATLRRLLTLAEQNSTPVLIVLDGQNWWGGRPDLWNWFDPTQPGYDPANRMNVEWTADDPAAAVKICWRNWGRQIRVLPQPNLAAPRFREATQPLLTRLASVVKEWAGRLPESQRFLYPGIKIGWEASVGINAYHYPNGNRYWEQDPKSDANDPRTGLDMKVDFAGGLPPLGYAAMRSMGTPKNGKPIVLADVERITAEYLRFLAGVCRKVGLPREEVFTHSGGQFVPYPRHYSYRVSINDDSTPGWSFYNVDPNRAGDLGGSLDRAGRQEWCAAEWLPFSRTTAEWTAAYRTTLEYRRCRFISVYNWEGISKKPEAVAGLRQYLGDAEKPRRT